MSSRRRHHRRSQASRIEAGRSNPTAIRQHGDVVGRSACPKDREQRRSVHRRTSQTRFRCRDARHEYTVSIEAQTKSAMEELCRTAQDVRDHVQLFQGPLTPAPWHIGGGARPAPGAIRRSRASQGRFPGYQRRHRLPRALRRADRAAVAARAQQILICAHMSPPGVAHARGDPASKLNLSAVSTLSR